MKKIVGLVLVSVLCLSLFAGCKPKDVSDHTYALGKETLNLCDEYLDIKIDEKEAMRKVNQLSKRLFMSETKNDRVIEGTCLTIFDEFKKLNEAFVSPEDKKESLNTITTERAFLARRIHARMRK